jgi:hypothetical protein
MHTIGQKLYNARKAVFEQVLNAICDQIVSSDLTCLPHDSRLTAIEAICNRITVYLSSEREQFLSFLINSLQIDPTIAPSLPQHDYPVLQSLIQQQLLDPSFAHKFST